MHKNLIFFVFVFLLVTNVTGQERIHPDEPFYINVFISPDKTIYVERNKTSFQEVGAKIAEIIRSKPFVIDQKIVYRIFADENLKLGYVMDVNREMITGYSGKVQTLKYLLNTALLNIDGQNWFKSIDLKKLED